MINSILFWLFWLWLMVFTFCNAAKQFSESAWSLEGAASWMNGFVYLMFATMIGLGLCFKMTFRKN